ncbi:MAG: GIY-YIG nuclease family protein [Anaerolineales bacterium]|nr:GIY-YIG nuclease family protein [Anaerolineales bacterium]MCW5855118.1 GIY-YIG nuclease family protein [Anaerolineales bacterium]
MAAKQFFPPRPPGNPRIYAYEETHPDFKCLLKVGYTTGSVEQRVAQQYPIVRPEKTWRILLDESAMRNDGTAFSDRDVHRYLLDKGFKNPDGEWFRCTLRDVKAALLALRTGVQNEDNRTLDFAMRPEQEEAVATTAAYFKKESRRNSGKTPHFLWNAKMRFGKTFAAYQLAQRMGWKRVLVLTFKPAVQHAWEEDLKTHIDFKGWQFISRNGLRYEEADKKKPFVCFGSFQDYLGRDPATGGIKPKNEWVHTIQWDCVILDEYHFGAWRERAKGLFEAEDGDEYEYEQQLERLEQSRDTVDEFEQIMPVTTGAYLYLSGTPFRAITTGEFIEEQIYNWTYADEQRAKTSWKNANNPYAALPRIVLLTYRLPDTIREIALQGEFNEFDLNTFFSAKGHGPGAKFLYQDEVQKWLDLIRGGLMETTMDDLKLGAKKPPMPFSDVRLLNLLSHTFWFLPNVAACHAMRNLLRQKQNRFYHDYEIIVAAGKEAGMGMAALGPVHQAMDEPLHTRTITLSCGKLATGVTVRPWTGIFMLRNSSTPETYFQAAFRVQSPWTMKVEDRPGEEKILKEECYIFDFAPERALRQIAEYSNRLNVNETNPEKKVAEFISFLPILAYDGSTMREVDAAGVLEMAMSGTTATLLARRWESALLVNVDNGTLARLMNNPKAMQALMSIEGFRSLNQDIETIISKSEAVQKVKREAKDRELTDKQKRELTEQEKEYKSKRRQIQEKLIKFATRIPVFMYLTDYRERALKDVITQLEPGLFKKVTGLSVADFEMLVSLGLFNNALMNDAIWKFKRYEDASLEYTGINKHADEDVGLYDTVLSRKDYTGQIFENLSEYA